MGDVAQDRHDEIVRRFPGGISPKQYREIVLYPHSLADWFAQQSLLMGMMIDGLITKRCRKDEAGPWYITDAGRAALKAREKQ